jgi:hypothetical protein
MSQTGAPAPATRSVCLPSVVRSTPGWIRTSSLRGVSTARSPGCATGVSLLASSGPAWNRTTDLPHVTRALWPLSYGPNADSRFVERMFPAAVERGAGLTAGKDSRPIWMAGSLSDAGS